MSENTLIAKMQRSLIALITIAILAFATLRATANDYSLATNVVMKNRVPWRVAVLLIDWTIHEGEERVAAVTSLVRYRKSPGLVPYLKKYSADADGSVRMAAFWPLYKNGQRDFAMDILRQELGKNHRSAAMVFFMPRQVGSEYKLELSKDDSAFGVLAEQVALNSEIDPLIRVYATIHLTSIDKKDSAAQAATKILSTIAPNDNSHLRQMAEWGLELAGKPLEKRAVNPRLSRRTSRGSR